jgi:rod shape-determining protein MreD
VVARGASEIMLSRKLTLALILLMLLCQLILRQRISFISGSSGQMITPDFLLLSVIFAGLGRGVLWGVVTGFVVGLIQDSFAPMHFGVNAFSKVIAGFISGRIGGRVFLHTATIVFLLIVGLKFLNDLLVSLFSHPNGFEGLISKLLIFIPGSSLYTSVVGLVLLWVLMYLRRGSLGTR